MRTPTTFPTAVQCYAYCDLLRTAHGSQNRYKRKQTNMRVAKIPGGRCLAFRHTPYIQTSSRGVSFHHHNTAPATLTTAHSPQDDTCCRGNNTDEARKILPITHVTQQEVTRAVIHEVLTIFFRRHAPPALVWNNPQKQIPYEWDVSPALK